MTSTIGPARAALFDMLAAAPALAGVQLVWGLPDAYEEHELIALRGTSNESEQPAIIGGPRPDDEFYDIDLTVKVNNPSGDARTVDTRGYQLAAAIHDVVHGDMKLTTTVVRANVASTRSAGALPVLVEDGNQQGWVIYVDVAVACHARA